MVVPIQGFVQEDVLRVREDIVTCGKSAFPSPAVQLNEAHEGKGGVGGGRARNGMGRDENLQSAGVAVTPLPDRDSQLVPGAQKVIHHLGSRENHRARTLGVNELVPHPLIRHDSPRRHDRRNSVRIERQVLVVADELTDPRRRPPGGALLAVVEVLALAGERVVAVGPETLDAGGHGHGKGDALVEDGGGEGALSKAGAAGYADAGGIDLGGGGVQGVENAVEAPGPGREDSWLVLVCSA